MSVFGKLHRMVEPPIPRPAIVTLLGWLGIIAGAAWFTGTAAQCLIQPGPLDPTLWIPIFVTTLFAWVLFIRPSQDLLEMRERGRGSLITVFWLVACLAWMGAGLSAVFVIIHLSRIFALWPKAGPNYTMFIAMISSALVGIFAGHVRRALLSDDVKYAIMEAEAAREAAKPSSPRPAETASDLSSSQ